MSNRTVESHAMSNTNIICCVDSSDERSDIVFEAAAHIVSVCQSAHLTVFSAHRAPSSGVSSPFALPTEREPRTIALHYEAKCVGRWSKVRFEVITAELPEATPIREGLMDVITALNGDIVVLGFTGRKGPKEDPKIMGSSTDLSLRNGGVSALIVKCGGPYKTIAVAFDGSVRSMAALTVAAHAALDAVKIIAIFVKTDAVSSDVQTDEERTDKATELVHPILAKIAAIKDGTVPTFKYVAVRCLDMESISQTFIRAADEEDASLLVASPRDHLLMSSRVAAADFVSNKLGSFCDALVRGSKIDTLIVHPQSNPDAHGVSFRT